MSIPDEMVKPRTSTCHQFPVDQNGATLQVSHVLLSQNLVKREKTKEWNLRTQHKIIARKKQNNISVETKTAQMDRKEDGNKITEAEANIPGHLSPQSLVSHH